MLALSSLDLCKSISKTLSGVIKENLFSEVPPKQPFTLTAFMLAVKISVLKTSLLFISNNGKLCLPLGSMVH